MIRERRTVQGQSSGCSSCLKSSHLKLRARVCRRVVQSERDTKDISRVCQNATHAGVSTHGLRNKMNIVYGGALWNEQVTRLNISDVSRWGRVRRRWDESKTQGVVMQGWWSGGRAGASGARSGGEELGEAGWNETGRVGTRQRSWTGRDRQGHQLMSLLSYWPGGSRFESRWWQVCQH